MFPDDLTMCLNENLIDIITFKQWVAVDWSALEMYTKPVNEFEDRFFKKLETLYGHTHSLQLSKYNFLANVNLPQLATTSISFVQSPALVLELVHMPG